MLKAYAATSADGVASETASELANLIQLIFTRIPLWIAGFIVIILSILAAKIARKVVENKLAEKGIEEEHQELQILGGRIAYTTVLTLGITVGLKIAGIDLTTIIAAVAFGIGFALRDLMMNFLAGIMILVGKHFVIGDFIKVGSTVGKVVEIQSRVTVMQAIDGTKVIVPNAEMFKKQVVNFTSNPFRRIEMLVTIDYRNSLENALKVCMKAVKDTKGIMVEPKPAVLVNEFGDNGVSLKIKAWVESKGGWVKIKSALTKNIKEEFDKHGIRIPWPIKTVAYDKDMEFNEKMLSEAQEEDEKQVQAPMVQNLQPQEVKVEDGDGNPPPLQPLNEQK